MPSPKEPRPIVPKMYFSVSGSEFSEVCCCRQEKERRRKRRTNSRSNDPQWMGGWIDGR